MKFGKFLYICTYTYVYTYVIFILMTEFTLNERRTEDLVKFKNVLGLVRTWFSLLRDNL